MLKPYYYGTEEETILELDGQYYLIQSPDLGDREYEELSELPEEFESLDPRLCSDIEIPNDLRTWVNGKNVSVVFAGELPTRWHGFTVVDGDKTDLRYLDPRGSERGYVIGLSLKSANNATRESAIASGFAV